MELTKEDSQQNTKESEMEPPPAPVKEIDFSEITIPVQLFFKFRDAIEEEDITQLEKELANLRHLGEEGEFLNKKLVPLAEQNELDEILDILERVKIMGKGHD